MCSQFHCGVKCSAAGSVFIVPIMICDSSLGTGNVARPLHMISRIDMIRGSCVFRTSDKCLGFYRLNPMAMLTVLASIAS